MKYCIFLLPLVFVLSCDTPSEDASSQLQVKGLQEPVEILRDQWGINHIYAENQHDLFFTQGYATAKDRLFQFEIWRRQATGTTAEILGERALKRDIGTRLFQFRGNMDEEMSYYHEDGIEIITAYTKGVNAYIEEVLANPELLPIEFKMLGIQPEKWTPEVVISRHQGLLGNIEAELRIGRAVAVLGADKVQDLSWFHPKTPDLSLDPSINKDLLFDNILGLYTAYRRPVEFLPEDLLPEYRKNESLSYLNINSSWEDSLSFGSNNWVVSGSKTVDGNTYMANDPHRRISIPSLRYMTHLVAPGWNVIGGGEPEIPGISIGHNEFGAWGLTVFRTDGEDLYIYDLNPDNLKEYRYQDEWRSMSTIAETIQVKGQESVDVELLYTHHGPVTLIDSVNFKAYAMRCAWLEPGGSPYLASLRMDQAQTWEEFRAACNYSHIPGENMVWADKEGNIGWQSVGIAPIRRNFSGLVPVPGDGRYEWDGYLPIVEKPNTLNPPEGFFATANQNVTPESYDQWDAIGYSWSDPFRGDRVNEVLAASDQLDMEKMKSLQVDYLSIPARRLLPLLLGLSVPEELKTAQMQLSTWNYELLATSIPAAIYVSWENELKEMAYQQFIPDEAKEYLTGIQMQKLLNWILAADPRFGDNPQVERDRFLVHAFENAVKKLEEDLGTDQSKWQYGQPKLKHSFMAHQLGQIADEEFQQKLNVGPFPRGGNGYTVGSTGQNMQQSSGASFRLIVNTGDWDAAVGMNGPGQSGNPDSEFYSNLFEPWAKDEFFPVLYSRSKIEEATVERFSLKPFR
jgi:penicillin amidase